MYITYEASEDAVGHLNPALTIGWAAGGELSWLEALLFIAIALSFYILLVVAKVPAIVNALVK